MQNTQEQTKAISLVQEGNDVLIMAGAGTGKSTTLRLIAKENPSKNFLVLCFNAANAVESNEHTDRPSNVYYSTIHSIAYRNMIDSKEMKAKLQPYLNYKDLSDIQFLKAGLCDMAKDAKDEKEVITLLRKAMQDAIRLYCISDSSNIKDFSLSKFAYWFKESEHLVQDDDIGTTKEKSIVLTEQQQLKLADLTNKYWLRMIDCGDSTSMTHDVYLKMYQLQGYSISSFYDKVTREEVMIDVLALDEAQDTNPCSLAIFNASKLQKIVVGDEMQQLYAWRGAGNAMECFPHFAKAYLSTSFRFNAEIADMSNVVLGKANSLLRLTGSGSKKDIVNHAYLFRKNVSILQHIFAHHLLDENYKVYVNADFKEVFSKLYHINALHFGTVPKFPNKSLKNLTNKGELEEALKLSPELKQMVKLSITIADNGPGLYAGIEKLKRCMTLDKDCVNVVSTIHRSKGMEYSSVTIGDDFLTVPKDGTIEEEVENMWNDSATISCLYVAITRAQIAVELPDYLQEVFGI
jgi:superfamily I DNA/RNA helicase